MAEAIFTLQFPHNVAMSFNSEEKLPHRGPDQKSFDFGTFPTNLALDKTPGVFGHEESIPHGPGA